MYYLITETTIIIMTTTMVTNILPIIMNISMGNTINLVH